MNANAIRITFILLRKLTSAKRIVCVTFQRRLSILKCGENIGCVSKSIDPDQMLSYSASDPEPYCFNILMVAISRLKVKSS